MVSDCLCDRRKVLDEENQDHPMISWYHHFNLKMIFQRLVHGFSIGLIILGIQNQIIAQELHPSRRIEIEQLLNYVRTRSTHSLLTGASEEALRADKCGFWIQAQLVNRWKEFSEVQKIELSMLMQAGIMQRDTIIGHFRISFDTSGTNTPAMLDGNNLPIPNSWNAYVDSVGKIFNRVWDVETGELGYAVPPLEDGNSVYNISIANLGSRDYGFMIFDESTRINPGEDPPRYWSSIQIDNDYEPSLRYTFGINALKVTAAHEFHHAIQIGSYGFWGNDIYAHEITSTWMEDVVFTEVNDYYQYLEDFFGNQNRTTGFWQGLSFISSNPFSHGYERCIWGHYLAKRFGDTCMTKVWEKMRLQPFLESTDAVLMSRGSNLQTAFAEFTNWNYYTADRADIVKYYSEGNHYPRFQPLQKTAFYNADATIGGDVSPLSSSMYEFDLASSDTLTAMIANIDVNAAELGQTLTKRVDVTLSSQALISPYYELENGLKAKIVVADFLLWQGFFSQSSTLQYVLKRLSNLAPNPFRINNDHQLFLPVNEDETGLAKVYLYSSSLSLVYTAEVNVTYQNKSMVVAVSGADLKSKLSSGVYFVIAKTKNNEYRWKVAVIR
jgi:hypothetical protein